MAEDTNSKGVIYAILLPSLMMIYVLSVGPAIYLVDNFNVPVAPFEIMYAPLEWLYEHIPALQGPLDWYVDLFM